MKQHHRVGIIILLCIMTLGPLSAREITISLQHPAQLKLEGILTRTDGTVCRILHTLPSASNSRQEATTTHLSNTSGGLVTTTLTINDIHPGFHSFFVQETGSTDASPARVWQNNIAVRVSAQETERVFTPRPDAGGTAPAGRIWHVLDLDGATGQTWETNYIFPFKRMLYGYVRDAATGLGADRAQVTLSDGHNRTSDAMQTEADGFFAFFPPVTGNWNLSLAREDSIALPRSSLELADSIPLRRDYVITRRLAANQLRLVLSWDRFPQDLDLHLSTKTTSGQAIHISSRDQKDFNGQILLNKDDRDGYGPETITLNNPDIGACSVWVQDAGPGSDGQRLATSSAVVHLYRGASLLGSFAVPAAPGTWWHVLDFDLSGRLQPVGSVGDTGPQP